MASNRALNTNVNPLRIPARSPQPAADPYALFDRLDGTHPWREAAPEGFVAYPIRRIHRAKVLYFNFALAKEMGLIPANHPNRLPPVLQRKILDRFAIQIINEYEQKKLKRKFSPEDKTHMATRYLQLQHADKTGRTSGDGRSIWNGTVRHRGVTWDVSSRGTGVTKLAPGSVAAEKFLKTGETTFGYGCGTADLDELYGSAIMSEIFHLQGISTERCLAIIDLGKGRGIGVRAAPNLFRPAHIFRCLKQGDTRALANAFDFIIDRQYQNGDWQISPSDKNRYYKAAEETAIAFAKRTARWDLDHIFVWLAWDGDNILIDGGIIDYGSIRQFGLRHDHYRYDDVERFSTSLNEQRSEARNIVKTFIQIADFLRTGRKRPLAAYDNHRIAKIFDDTYETAHIERFLYRIGLGTRERLEILTKQRNLAKELYAEFSYFEKAKTARRIAKLPDGINRPAIFNTRKLLYHLPGWLYKRSLRPLTIQQMFKMMHTESASKRDLKWKKSYGPRLLRLQEKYLELFATLKGRPRDNVNRAAHRSRVINRLDRITGNAIDIGVREIMAWKKQGIPADQIQKIIDAFIQDQVLVPDTDRGETAIPALKLSAQNRLLNSLMAIVFDYMEDV
ncbi:MAG: hypothetical protein ABL958_00440 [Bdellovibrionia bacterium]